MERNFKRNGAHCRIYTYFMYQANCPAIESGALLPSKHKLRKSKTNTSASCWMPPAINRVQKKTWGADLEQWSKLHQDHRYATRRPEMRYTFTQNLDKTLDWDQNNDYKNKDKSGGSRDMTWMPKIGAMLGWGNPSTILSMEMVIVARRREEGEQRRRLRLRGYCRCLRGIGVGKGT
jgi:hypothetical protein